MAYGEVRNDRQYSFFGSGPERSNVINQWQINEEQSIENVKCVSTSLMMVWWNWIRSASVRKPNNNDVGREGKQKFRWLLQKIYTFQFVHALNSSLSSLLSSLLSSAHSLLISLSLSDSVSFFCTHFVSSVAPYNKSQLFYFISVSLHESGRHTLRMYKKSKKQKSLSVWTVRCEKKAKNKPNATCASNSNLFLIRKCDAHTPRSNKSKIERAREFHGRVRGRVINRPQCRRTSYSFLNICFWRFCEGCVLCALRSHDEKRKSIKKHLRRDILFVLAPILCNLQLAYSCFVAVCLYYYCLL